MTVLTDVPLRSRSSASSVEKSQQQQEQQQQQQHQQQQQQPRHSEEPATKRKGWPWQLKLWKSRLPVVVVPVLASLRSLSDPAKITGVGESELLVSATGTLLGLSRPVSMSLEFGILMGLAATTGYFQMPFSVTWWLILMAACALEADMLIGVATLLSLTVLLGWYGIRLRYPHAVMALWGGARRSQAAPQDRFSEICWQVWDVVVHLMPGLLMVRWYMPSLTSGVGSGVGFWSALAALPLNLIWLWFFGLSKQPDSDTSKPWLVRRHIWPMGLELKETNAAYNVEPALPSVALEWAFGSHLFVCASIAAWLGLPTDVAIAYGVFAVHGLLWQPFTTAWWIVWLISLFSPHVGPLYRGIVACCGATVAIGWYGTQFLVPSALECLVGVWLFDPVDRLAPTWVASRMALFRKSRWSMIFATMGDMGMHFFPTLAAVILYRHEVTTGAALIAMPSNFLYLICSRTITLSDTNRIYGVKPQPPNYVWTYIYGSHVVTCAVVALLCFLSDCSTSGSAEVGVAMATTSA